MQGFDVIGDVHGMADKLHALLKNLGYRRHEGVWRHPQRQALFIGDLIDNGLQSIETLTTVRDMVEHGSARAIMGNHELNAIGWEMRHSQTGEPLREHSDANLAHHQAFLDSIPQREDRLPWLNWFKTLPLYLELDEPGLGPVRFVHACWHPTSITALQPYLNSHHQLRDDAWEVAFEEGHIAFNAVENILKGIEIDLPNGMSFTDHKGKQRHSTRISWWLKDADNMADMVHIPMPTQNQHVLDALRQRPAQQDLLEDSCYQGQCPVFFGHYWLRWPARVLNDKAACTDYSAGKDGPLVAYRWSGESVLSDNNWVSSAAS